MNRNILRIAYLTIGMASLLFFAWTGHYLRTTYPDKQGMDTGFRIMLRSRHIFILLVSLLEVGIGTYIQPAERVFFRKLQSLATALLLLAHGLFIWAFFYEVSPRFVPDTPIVHGATYLVLASLVLHSLILFDRG